MEDPHACDLYYAELLSLPYGAPGVSTGFRFINGLTVGDEGILHLPNTGVAPEEIRRTRNKMNH